MKNLTLVVSLLVFYFLGIYEVKSQNIEMGLQPDSVSSIQLDYNHVLITDSDLSVISGNYLLRYKHVLNENINLVGEGVFNYISADGESENALGNIYLGAQFKLNTNPNINSSVNAGIFVPTAGEGAINGVLSNIYDIGRYYEDNIGLQAGYTHYHHFANGFRLGFELASTVTIPTADDFQDPELFGKYGLSFMYKTDSGLFAISELLGVAILTEDNGDFDENTNHTYAFGLGYEWSSFSFGVSYRNFFDELFSDDFKGTLGVQLRLMF